MPQIYYLHGGKVTLVSEYTYKDREYCVVYGGDDDFTTCRKSDLQKWEETWHYQEEQKRKARLEQWKACEDQIVERMQNKAIKSLASRIKLNAFFGKSGGGAAYTLVIMEELEKLIKEDKDPDVKSYVQKIRQDTQTG